MTNEELKVKQKAMRLQKIKQINRYRMKQHSKFIKSFKDKSNDN